MRASLVLAFLLCTALSSCESKKACEPNPCNSGKCIEDAKNPGDFTCECPKGMVGMDCGTVDLCVKNNPCKDGKVCTLDGNYKPLCNCPPGYSGTKCESSE